MKNNKLANIVNSYRDEFSLYKKIFNKRNVLFVATSLTLFLYLLFSLLMSRRPFNYVYNVLFFIFTCLTIILAFKRKQFCINGIYFFLIPFMLITGVINLSKHIFTITPYVDVLNAIVIFLFLSLCNENEKDMSLRIIYISLILLLFFVAVRYTLPIIRTRNSTPFNDAYFHNADGLSNYLSFLFMLSLFYFLRGHKISLFTSLFSFVFVVLTTRRTAFLLLFISICVFLAFAYKRYNKKIFYAIIAFIGVGAIVLFLLPFGRTMINRFVNLLGVKTSTVDEGSANERIILIMRGLFYGGAYPFKSLGYNTISNYVITPNHDTYGDLAFSYGGFISIVSCFAIVAGSVKCILSNNKYKFILISFGFSLLVLLILSAIFSTRLYCFFAGAFYALTLDKNIEERPMEYKEIKTEDGFYFVEI